MRSEYIQTYSSHKSAQAFHKAGMPDALRAPPSQEPLENDTAKRLLAEVLGLGLQIWMESFYQRCLQQTQESFSPSAPAVK